MRIKLTDPVRTDDLVDFLRRCDCTVNVLAAGLLEAEPRELPIDPTLRQPELELDAYLGIWSALRRRERSARHVKRSGGVESAWQPEMTLRLSRS